MSKISDKTIIRVKKSKSKPFVIMDKTGLYDNRLSLKAKGLLAYLLSKPDDWKVMISELVNSCSDGKWSIYNGLKELEEYGYIKRVRVYRISEKTGKKVIVRWDMIIFEEPSESENIPNSIFEKDNTDEKDKDHETLDTTASYLLPKNLKIGNLKVGNQEIDNQEIDNQEIGNQEIENLKAGNQEIGNLDLGNQPLLNNELLNINNTNKYNNKDSTKPTGRKRKTKKESPYHQGDFDDVVVAIKDQIEKLTGGKVQIQTLKRILAQPHGFEKINHAFGIYPYMRDYITRYQPIENTVGLFFYIAENMVDLPVSIRSTGKKVSFNNFEQHTYSDEELESLYEDIEGEEEVERH